MVAQSLAIKRAFWLLVLFWISSGPLSAQDPPSFEGSTIAHAEVSGMRMGALSPGLGQAIDAPVDTPYSEEYTADRARRIEQEQPSLASGGQTSTSGFPH